MILVDRSFKNIAGTAQRVNKELNGRTFPSLKYQILLSLMSLRSDQITFRFILHLIDKILDWSKFKAFANNKINVTENSKFVLETIENIVRKRENAGVFSPCPAFSPFPTMFSKGFFCSVLKSRDCVGKH